MSTIFQKIFQHPDLAWVSNYQAIFPNTNKINLLRNIFDNRFWQIKGQKKELNKVPFFNKLIFRPGEVYSYWNKLTGRDFGREFLYQVRETEDNIFKLRTFFEGLVKCQKRKRLSFKITGPSRLEYLNSIFPDAKYIWIKREPLPNIRSLLNVYFYQDRKNDLWWKNEVVYSEEEKEKATEWKDEPAFIAALQYYKVNQIYQLEKKNSGISSSVIEVSYEDFIKQPKKEIRRILDHIDLDSNCEIIDFLNLNKIYDRNKYDEYFFSKKSDAQIHEISKNGILNL